MGDTHEAPYISNPQFFNTKFGTGNYICHIPDARNLVKIRSQAASLRLREIIKYNVCDFLYLSIFFLSSPTAETTEPILTHDSSYDPVSCKEVPSGGLDNDQ